MSSPIVSAAGPHPHAGSGLAATRAARARPADEN